jgi:ATPase subunit of ABC transporter with duplicated ATPase domains
MSLPRRHGGTFARRPGQGPRVAFVGPCGAGKSTIVRRLRELGLDARMPAQEHSGVAEMWQKLLNPDYLIALDAPNAVLRQRRPGIDLNDAVLAEERRRLAHAFTHADLMLDTSRMEEREVIEAVLRWLRERGAL